MTGWDPKYTLDDFQEKIKITMNAGGLFDRDDIKKYSRFSRLGFFDPYNMMGTTHEYVFFTKPDLNIFNNGAAGILNPALANIPIFAEALRSWPKSLLELDRSINPSQDFSPLLFNSRVSALDLPDIEGGDEETGENMWGTKVFYRRASTASQDNFDFSLEFHDTRFLDLYMYFRLYDAYEERKSFGRVAPRESHIFNRELHDQTCVYKFIVGEDFRTIVYYAKLYGVYPKNAPRAAFSNMPEDGNFNFTVNFKANWVEDMDPNILIDFNESSRKLGPFKSGNMHDVDAGFSGAVNSFSPGPFVVRDTSRYRDSRFLLLWR